MKAKPLTIAVKGFAFVVFPDVFPHTFPFFQKHGTIPI